MAGSCGGGFGGLDLATGPLLVADPVEGGPTSAAAVDWLGGLIHGFFSFFIFLV